jgi:SAM-dependent methyltransferase
VTADAQRLPLASKAFDLVVALDLLEHVPSDGAAASEFRRVLRDGGRLITTVPAYQALWSSHDVALMHHRRYLARHLRSLLVSSRLSPIRLGYSMTLLLPLVWVVRLLDRRNPNPKATLVPVPRIVNTWLSGLLRLENWIASRSLLPCGVSVVAVAERRP